LGWGEHAFFGCHGHQLIFGDNVEQGLRTDVDVGIDLEALFDQLA
jgi:hypothetical protein